MDFCSNRHDISYRFASRVSCQGHSFVVGRGLPRKPTPLGVVEGFSNSDPLSRARGLTVSPRLDSIATYVSSRYVFFGDALAVRA